jgi:hypothetical protein
MRTKARKAYTWGFLGLLVLACGEARTLEVFPKKPRPSDPPPPAAVRCGDVACPREQQLCLEERCVECIGDADCGPQRGCFANSCVECTANEHCPMTKVCNVAVHRCTEPCTSAEPCTEKSRSVCDLEHSWCVECLGDTDCKAQHLCDLMQHTCVKCGSEVACVDAGPCPPSNAICAPTPPGSK